MTQFSCHDFQYLIKSGARLHAGIQLRPEDQQALQDHMHHCAACRALAARLDTLDDLLRTSAHARGAVVPRPSRELSRRFTVRAKENRLQNNLKRLAWAVLGLVIIASAGILLAVRPPSVTRLNEEKIIQNPGAYMLRLEDLPPGVSYYTPDEPLSESKPLAILESNETISLQIGPERAAKLITDTGRLTGWRVVSQSVDADAPGADTIRVWMSVHQTDEGAQTMVRDYSPAGKEFQSSQPWQPLGAVKDLGSMATASQLVFETAPTWKWIHYRVDFSYHQVSVRVVLTDKFGDIQLEDTLEIASLILSHLKEAEETNVRQ
jgi:hypothetical protein